MKLDYDYVIVGGGLTGASAVEGIRELDSTGSILLICEENHLPYDIFLHDQAFYDKHAVTLALGSKTARIDPGKKTVTNTDEKTFSYKNCYLQQVVR